jgi:hypothetical protein
LERLRDSPRITLEKMESIKDGIRRIDSINRKLKNLRGNRRLGDDFASREIIKRTSIEKNVIIKFKYETNKGGLGKPQNILAMRNGSVYSVDKTPAVQKALSQFKDLLTRIPHIVEPLVLDPLDGQELNKETQPSTSQQVEEEVDLNKIGPLVEGETWELLNGLTPDENRETESVTNPGEGSVQQSRIGDHGSLQIQADEFKMRITEEESTLNNLESTFEEKLAARDRIDDLRMAIDTINTQRIMEEYEFGLNEKLESDYGRYERFKE